MRQNWKEMGIIIPENGENKRKKPERARALSGLEVLVYLPAMESPSTSTSGDPKAVLPVAMGRWQLLAAAVMFFSTS